MKGNMIRYVCLYLISWLLCSSCSEKKEILSVEENVPAIFPDYIGVTIPVNIAPLNFSVREEGETFVTSFESLKSGYNFEIEARNKSFNIPLKQWRLLLKESLGGEVQVTIMKKRNEKWSAYQPFLFYVANEPIDDYLVYRLIEPGYALWNQMGIYQRNLTDFKQTVIYENKMGQLNCVNCHSFCMNDPEKMLLHMRASNSGTLVIEGKDIKKIASHSIQEFTPLVYPYWHPDGRYIAFSVNETTQEVHATQRVEVFDVKSDVIVYDKKEHKALISPFIASSSSFETFPSFSPDGKYLYYCTAPICAMPDSIQQLKYSICRIPFNSSTGTFGNQVDTIYNARLKGDSFSFPRVSPDGRFLMCTRSDYGTFPIWHQEADLCMIDLEKGEECDLSLVNSNDTESYHSWSSNGRWVVFSSRRLDGLYTRPFIAYVSERGEVFKPFLLPQQDTDFYSLLMKSFNIPEFVKGAVTVKRLNSFSKKISEK